MAADEEARQWRERRAEAAAAHAAAAARERARDSAAARILLDEFRAELERRGIAAQPLRAVAGSTRYRTGLTGWTLRRNGSLGLTVDGEFVVLAVAPSLAARVVGVRVAPSEPSLQVGRGARDGESIGLAELLGQRLTELADP